jgi:hypothetical protein
MGCFSTKALVEENQLQELAVFEEGRWNNKAVILEQ